MALTLSLAVLAVLPAVGNAAPPSQAPSAKPVAQAPTAVAAAPGAGGAAKSHAVRLRGVTLDTSRPVRPPAELAAEPSDGPQLRLVQFSGPIKPAWYEGLESAGRVVSYVPDNAYLVWVSGAGADALDAQAGKNKAIQYSGPFDPAYRLSPDLTGKDAPEDKSTDVTIQVVANPQGLSQLESLLAGRKLLVEPYTLVGLRTASVRVPSAQLHEIVTMSAVVNVEPYARPVLNDEVQNQLLAGNVQTVGGKTVPTAPGYLAWLGTHSFPTTAASYPKVVVVDDGIDNGGVTPIHDDFYVSGVDTNASRLTSNDDCTADPGANGVGGHGNINAGIVGGFNNQSGAAFEDAGGYQYGLGVSPYGLLGGLKIFRNAGSFDISACGGNMPGVVQQLYNAGADIGTNSWGAPVFGAYNADSQAFDALVRDATSSVAGNQELLQIFSAGNSGPGANSLGSPGTAKNVLTVGATENVREDGALDGCAIDDADNDSDIIGFSSRGPADDGRVKPDVVAAGTHVMGPASQDPGYNGTGVCGDPSGSADPRYHPQGQTLYTWSSGTSHSTPAVAGAVSLIQEYYGRVLEPGDTASPAMLKALVDNVPRYLAGGTGTGDTLPSNNQGYGVPDLGTLFDSTTDRYDFDQSHLFTASGQSFVRAGTVTDAAKPVRVTLAWTDAPGPTVGAAYVNNLDLVVSVGGETYKGNVFSGGLSTAGGVADDKNNVENVYLPPGTTGPISVQVQATNIAGNGVPANASTLDQDFALTVSNVDVTPQAVASDNGITWQDSPADGNATADPGELITITASIANLGDAGLPAGSGALSVVSGPAAVVQGSSGYPAIAAGDDAVNQTAYTVRISSTTDCSTPVVIDHTYTAAGQTVVQDLTIPLGAPAPPVTYTSTDVPKAIPDNNASGVNSTLMVPGTPTLLDVKVHLDITHTWVADLEARLTSPTGTVVTLFADVGGSGDNFTGTVLSDDAATPIGSGSAPFTGEFRPQQPLAAFDGESANGTWTLNVNDDAGADTGQLTDWAIEVMAEGGGTCDAAPTVSVADATAVAEGGTLSFPVTITGADAGGTYSVDVTTTGGTATGGSDYTVVDQTLTWNPGDPATKQVAVTTTDDPADEPDETVEVTLSSPDGTPQTPAIVTGTASGTITDNDDASAPIISVADAPAVGEGGPMSFPVTITGADPAGTYTVNFATTGGSATSGSDYTAVNQTLTWNPGDPATKQVPVATTNDAFDEANETVQVTLTSPGGTPVPPVIGTSGASGTITDNDTVSISVADAAAVNEGGTLSFPVTVTGANPAGTYSVHVATSGGTATSGSDYTAVNQTLTWNPGDPATKQVTVATTNDAFDEANETVGLALDSPTGSTPDVTLGASTASGTITDNDTVTISVANASAVNEGGTLSFPVTITGANPTGSYSVHVATSGGTATAGSDYTAVNQTLTWNAGDPATKQVTVATANDALDEADETVGLALDSPTGSTPDVTLGASTASGTITDDDTAPPPPPAVKVSLAKAKKAEGDHGKRTMKFKVTLSAPSSTPVTFTWQTKNKSAKSPADYKAARGAVTFAPGVTVAKIKVKIVGDVKAELNEKFKIVTAGLTGATWAGKSTTTGKILDDD